MNLLNSSLYLIFVHTFLVFFIHNDMMYYAYVGLMGLLFIGAMRYEHFLNEKEIKYYPFFTYALLFSFLAEIVAAGFLPYSFPHISDPFFLFATGLNLLGVIAYLRIQGLKRWTLFYNVIFWYFTTSIIIYEYFLKPFGIYTPINELGQIVYTYLDLATLMLLVTCLKINTYRDISLFCSFCFVVWLDTIDFYINMNLTKSLFFYELIDGFWLLALYGILLLPDKPLNLNVCIILNQCKLLIPCFVLLMLLYMERYLVTTA